MRRMKIIQRDVSDIDGDPVDVFPRSGPLYSFALKPIATVSRESILTVFADAFAEFRPKKGKKRGLPDLLVFLGDYVNAVDDHLVLVGVVGTTSSSLEKLFNWLYDHLPGYIEVNLFDLSDAEFEPLARLIGGQVVFYKQPGVDPTEERNADWAKGAEWRSWQWKEEPAGSSEQPDSEIQTRVKVPHDIDYWIKNRLAVLRYLDSIRKPVGYHRLKKEIISRFGISVFEEDDPKFLRYGAIRTSRLGSEGCEITILVNRWLDDREKYFVLAHELSHYVLHYPLLYYGQIMEEASWSKPEFELIWEDIRRSIPGGIAMLERQANLLAIGFLIRARLTDLRAYLDENVIRTHSDPILLMAFERLQPWFPNMRPTSTPWNRPEWRESALKLAEEKLEAVPDLNSANAESVFQAALAAAIEAEEDGLDLIDAERTQDLVDRLTKACLAPFLAIQDYNDIASERAVLREMIPKELLARPCIAVESAAASEIGNFLRGADRELVPPRGWKESHCLFPRIPLRPATWNTERTMTGEWVDVRDEEHAPVGTIDEWLDWGGGLVLYRFLAWQKKSLEALSDPVKMVEYLQMKIENEQ